MSLQTRELTIRIRSVVGLIFVVGILFGCGADTNLVPEFEAYQRAHSKLAILPIRVGIDADKLPRGVTRAQHKELLVHESAKIQQDLYIYFIDRYDDGKITVDFQDIIKTNSLLQQAGLSGKSLRDHSYDEIAEILGVDAVVDGYFYLEEPISAESAVLLAAAFGWSRSTNHVTAGLQIYDGQDGAKLWWYSNSMFGNSSETLVTKLLKDMSRKFPYKS